MNVDIIYKLLKYLIQGVIIFSLFRFVPTNPMPDWDILLITIIIVLIYAVMESIYCSYSSSTMKPVCSCPVETMAVVSQDVGVINGSLNGVVDNASVGSISNQTILSNSSSNLPSNLPSNITPTNQVTPNTNFPTIQEAPKLVPQNMMPGFVDPRFPKMDVMNDGIGYEYKPYVSPEVISMGSRANDGVIQNDYVFNDFNQNPYTDFNSMPMMDAFKNGTYERGFSYLPPKDWYPVPPHPPVCVSEKRSIAYPNMTTGYPADMKEWGDAIRITPPDQFNTVAITTKLNAGR